MTKQRDRVLKHMMDNGTITSIEAVEKYGVLRLAGVVYRLKSLGYNIVTETEYAKNRYGDKVKYARYRLVDAV